MQLKKLTASELSLLFIFTVTVVYYSINIHEVICGQSSGFSWISFWSAGVVFIQTTCWASAVRVVNTNIHQKYNRERNYRELLFGYLGMHHLKQMHGSVLFHNWNKRSHCACKLRLLNPLMGTGNYSAHRIIRSGYTGRWWVAVTFGTVRRGLGGLGPRPVPSSLYQM